MSREDSILFLGPDDQPTLAWLRAQGERVTSTADAVDAADADGHRFLVSHGYRHILRRPVLERFPGRAINLHIAYLPYNRGADPNFWSVYEDTPKGVTIHLLDEGIDTGDIVAQELVPLADDDTLRTSYARLQQRMLELFVRTWPDVRAERLSAVPQGDAGTTHRVADLARVGGVLSDGWDTPLHRIRQAGAES